MSLTNLCERNRDVFNLITVQLSIDDLITLCKIDRKSNKLFNNFNIWGTIWKLELSDDVPETVNIMKIRYLRIKRLVEIDIDGIFPPMVFRHYFSAGFEKKLESHFYLLDRDTSPNGKLLYIECLGLSVNRKLYRTLRELVKYRPFPRLSDSALFKAIEMADFEAVKILVDAGTELNQVRLYFPPLASAVYINNIDIVKLLLEKGARTGLARIGNISALEAAVYYKNTEMITLLIMHGANPTELPEAFHRDYLKLFPKQ